MLEYDRCWRIRLALLSIHIGVYTAFLFHWCEEYKERLVASVERKEGRIESFGSDNFFHRDGSLFETGTSSICTWPVQRCSNSVFGRRGISYLFLNSVIRINVVLISGFYLSSPRVRKRILNYLGGTMKRRITW